MRGCQFAVLSASLLEGCNHGTSSDDSGVDAGQEDSGSAGAGLGEYCNPEIGAECASSFYCANESTGNAGVCSATCISKPCVQGSCLGPGYCVVRCTQSTDCPSGDVCADYGPLCFPDCRIHPDECAPSVICSSAVGQCAEPGNGQFGQHCGGPDGGCAKDLWCVSLSEDGAGFCSQPCDTASPCPTSPSGAVCGLKRPNGTFCAWSCQLADGGSCPTGLTCQGSDAGALCQ
jgi:hypothetical protein